MRVLRCQPHCPTIPTGVVESSAPVHTLILPASSVYMQPYVFFDVAKGREKRREGGGSVSNRVRVVPCRTRPARGAK